MRVAVGVLALVLATVGGIEVRHGMVVVVVDGLGGRRVGAQAMSFWEERIGRREGGVEAGDAAILDEEGFQI